MATSQDEPPTLRRDSPSPELLPKPALGPEAARTARAELSRSASTASSASHGSATTNASRPRESLGSFVSASDASSFSRHSSASFQSSSRRSDVSFLSTSTSSNNSRHSTMSLDRHSSSATAASASKRRGYMRPTGTDFAASARQRESVLSLGSITHLQYYFARTGMLDGKGGQLARKRNGKAQTLDFSQLDPSSFLLAAPNGKPGSGNTGGSGTSDVDSSYASMGSSPDLGAHGNFLVDSPIQDDEEDYYLDEYDEPDPSMLPPTTSTYKYREKPIVKPPSTKELRAELDSALDAASKTIAEAKTSSDSSMQSKAEEDKKKDEGKAQNTLSPQDTEAKEEEDGASSPAPARSPARGWHEVQGVHILDVMTLAIRAAKVYYTGHDHPDRLDSIKAEKAVRAELLGVMDVLKRMATRNFAGGMRDDEGQTMEAWVASLRDMLRREDAIVAGERRERAAWTWLRDADWTDPDPKRAFEREFAFIQSMMAGSAATAPPPSTKEGAPPPALMRPTTPTSAQPSSSLLSTSGPLADKKPPSASTTPTASTFAAAAAAAAVTKPIQPADEQPAQYPPLPPWTPIDRASPESQTLPTPFLKAMQNGLALVRLHNAAVRKSQRRFGAIASYHVDTAKPYRGADNIRYWLKAAELRWELHIQGVDALAVVYDNGGAKTWIAFEDAILTWCHKVREEIASELVAAGMVDASPSS